MTNMPMSEPAWVTTFAKVIWVVYALLGILAALYWIPYWYLNTYGC